MNYRGVLSHFNGQFPAALSDLMVKDSLTKVVGASAEEVVAMNGLTVNIHLLLISFYQPTASRYKIIIEDHAFPSDRVNSTIHSTWGRLGDRKSAVNRGVWRG